MGEDARGLFMLAGARPGHPEVAAWRAALNGPLAPIARAAFELLETAGADVETVMHDGQATACVAGAAFAYVAVFRAHVGVGFFHGAALADPATLLEGSGRFMRHVKLREDASVQMLAPLVATAHADIRERLAQAVAAGPTA